MEFSTNKFANKNKYIQRLERWFLKTKEQALLREGTHRPFYGD